MSEDSSYEPLAEVYLSLKDAPPSEIVYCLCSRVVLSSPDVQDLEGQETLLIEEFAPQPPIKATEVRASIESVESLVTPPVQVFKRKENEEAVSCYCSASHCSTDEHDSVREAEAALHSDSGADLSESSKDLDWERHWARHGERLVWESWIKKYGEYVDPSFYNRTQEDFSEDTQFNITGDSESGRKSFTGLLLDSINEEIEKAGPSPDDVLEATQHDFDNFSEISETSGTGDDYFRLRSCSRSSRSSLQTDSLTNVTAVTIYSSELSCSAEESSAQSTSNSFISSSDSISSNEVQWQQLWVEHFNEQYQACYEAFLSRFETSPADESYPTVFEDNPSLADYDLLTESGFDNTIDDPSSKEEVTVIVVGCDQEENKENISKYSPARGARPAYKPRKPREPRASKTHSVGYLLNSLRSLSVAQDSVLGEIDSLTKMDSPQLKEDVELSSHGSAPSEPLSLDHSHSDGDLMTFSPRESVTSPPSHQHHDTATSYDESEAKSSDVCTVINCDSSDEEPRVAKNLKRVHGDNNSSLEKTKGAFSLMGFVFSEGERKNVEKAHVVYRKRNIRYHNRMLKLPRPNHIRFDDDGNPIILDKVKQFIQDQSSTQPASGSVELENPQVEIDDFSEKDDETTEEEEENFLSAEEWSANLSGAERKERPTKRRKRKLRRKKLPSSITLPVEIQENEKLKKYWYQRYRLFSKFDKGIRLDEESWYSVTPEEVSKHLAERCRCDLIVDACCGAGGNTIQFAFTCEKVIAIDIDPKKIELARHNAKVYGVANRIEFIVGDFLQLAPKLQAEVVFLSPPWGGPSYMASPSYPLASIQVPGGGEALYKAAVSISPHVAYFLPKNINTSELVHMVGPGGSVEVEQNFLDKKLVAVTAYFGELVDSA